jgi:phospholipid transport system substrate-binding protein
MNKSESSRQGIAPTYIYLRLLCAIGVLLLNALFSQSAMAQIDAQQTIYALNKELAHVAQVNASGDDTEALRLQRLEEVVSHHADFTHTASLVLGKAWTEASELQRKEFTIAFRTLLLGTFADQMVRNAGTTTRIDTPRVSRSGRVAEVRSQINPVGGGKQEVRYYLRKTVDSWKLFNISIDGVSLVSIYTGTIRSRVRTIGLDRLIAELAKRNRALFNA